MNKYGDMEISYGEGELSPFVTSFVICLIIELMNLINE